MKRLRLWLARLLLPRGWGVVPVEPGKVYRAVLAGERVYDGDIVCMEPRADTLGQDDLTPPTS